MLCELTMIGRLGKNPESRALPNGDKVVNFSVASTKKKRDGETTVWIKMTAFGRQAEICEQYLQKGDLAYFRGDFELKEWEDRETGATRTSAECTLRDMKMLGSKRDSQDQQSAPPARQARQPAPAKPDFDDDVPF